MYGISDNFIAMLVGAGIAMGVIAITTLWITNGYAPGTVSDMLQECEAEHSQTDRCVIIAIPQYEYDSTTNAILKRQEEN